jgi:hypothetical protein
MSRNDTEDSVIAALQEKALFDQIMPAIREAVQSGGGADAILKRSEPLAAVKLVQHSQSDDPHVSLKASTEILNRVSGKPVERSVNVFADISKMNEKDVDAQIMMLLEKTGATPLIEAVVDSPKKALPTKVKQKRKPRLSKPLADEQPKE